MRFLFKVFGVLGMSHAAYAGLIYGVDQVDKYRHAHYPAYVQMGNFSTMRAAERLQHQIHANTKVPVVVQSSRGQYKVKVGPFRNPSSLKAFARRMTGHTHPQQSRPSTSVLKPRSQVHLSNESVSAVSTVLAQQSGHPELSVFLGGSYIPNSIKGQTLQLLPYEIGQYADTFTNQSGAGAFTWGIDALYRFQLHAPSTQHYFFDSLGAGVDIFQITNFNQKGNVLEFGLPEFENYTYALKLNNIRIMANIDLDLHPIQQQFIPFIQGGIGSARTEVSYNSAPIPPVESPNFILPKAASWNFAYQVGGGIKYAANLHLVLSLRYLYANMGKTNSSTLGSSAILAAPFTVDMSTQNFLFGLTYIVE